MGQVTIISGVERRRLWSDDQKRALVMAVSQPGANVAEIAFILSLIATAKLNDIDPQAWLADVLARIADIPQNRLHDLLPIGKPFIRWIRKRSLQPDAAEQGPRSGDGLTMTILPSFIRSGLVSV